MKRSLSCLVFLLIVSFPALAQKITYSETDKEDNRDIRFEVLGKVGEHYLVYKNVRWKHIVQVFDKEMKSLNNERMKFIPDKTFNADFVVYPDHVVMIYQYQKNNIVYCKAVKLDQDANPVGDEIMLDTTKISLLTSNKIYSTTFSEDKKKILLYKLQTKNNRMGMLLKRFDSDIKMLDSTRFYIPFDDRRDVYSDFDISNDGTIVFLKETTTNFRDNVNNLEITTLPLRSDSFISRPVELGDKYIDEVVLKIDNLNQNYLVNAFYFAQKRAGSVQGLFSAIVDKSDLSVRRAFNVFSDSLRSKISNSGQFRFAFDDMFVRNIFLKRDGSYLLVAEDFSQTRSGNNFNRWDYLYNSPYNFNSDYYFSNRSNYGYGYYRPYNSYSNIQSIRYDYDNVMIAGLDSSLNLQWSTIINKKQSDYDTDNFLSYATMNSGAEIHFLFIEKERNSQIISDQSINPLGALTRYPTLKSREAGYQFMPKLGKQVGVRTMIIPCIYRGYIAFAKVDF
ncbi:MAG: hypothetical protein JWQ27_1209 [Ferruginibacter sp.]|nr:hypothetical protein [Ferruginibacter sp.]